MLRISVKFKFGLFLLLFSTSAHQLQNCGSVLDLSTIHSGCSYEKNYVNGTIIPLGESDVCTVESSTKAKDDLLEDLQISLIPALQHADDEGACNFQKNLSVNLTMGKFQHRRESVQIALRYTAYGKNQPVQKKCLIHNLTIQSNDSQDNDEDLILPLYWHRGHYYTDAQVELELTSLRKGKRDYKKFVFWSPNWELCQPRSGCEAKANCELDPFVYMDVTENKSSYNFYLEDKGQHERGSDVAIELFEYNWTTKERKLNVFNKSEKVKDNLFKLRIESGSYANIYCYAKFRTDATSVPPTAPLTIEEPSPENKIPTISLGILGFISVVGLIVFAFLLLLRLHWRKPRVKFIYCRCQLHEIYWKPLEKFLDVLEEHCDIESVDKRIMRTNDDYYSEYEALLDSQSASLNLDFVAVVPFPNMLTHEKQNERRLKNLTGKYLEINDKSIFIMKLPIPAGDDDNFVSGCEEKGHMCYQLMKDFPILIRYLHKRSGLFKRICFRDSRILEMEAALKELNYTDEHFGFIYDDNYKSAVERKAVGLKADIMSVRSEYSFNVHDLV